MSFLDNMLGGAGIGAAQDALGGAIGGYQQCTEADLLKRQYDMQAQQYTSQLAQSMMNTKNAVAQNVYSQMGKQAQPIPFNPNEIEAYKISLSNLVTLWQAKFGDEWVSKFEDDFWADAMFRLEAAGKLEVAKHVWYRIKEDA